MAAATREISVKSPVRNPSIKVIHRKLVQLCCIKPVIMALPISLLLWLYMVAILLTAAIGEFSVSGASVDGAH